jgi:predicted RNase H-like HicB family nuclease
MIRQGPYDGEKLDWEWIRYETENEKPFSKGIEMFSVSVDIVLERDGEEYHAYCPAFDGLHTCGKDREDAVKNARDAVEAYVKSLLKHYEPIPCCKVIDEEMIPDLKIIKKKDIVHENIEIPVSNRCL